MGIFVVFTSAIIVFFRNINSYPLRNWDEAWYAEVIKNIANRNGPILLPVWNSRLFFDNSPLYLWLSTPFALFADANNPSQWQFRIVSAFFALVATLLVFLIGKKLKDEKLGLLSAAVFLTLGQVVIRFAHGNLDATLIALFLASFYFYQKSQEQKIFAVFCGITLGLGILTKSWGVGAFPFLLIFIYSAFKNKALPKNTVLILLFAILSSFWWYIWGIITIGKDFLSWFVLNPTEGRIEGTQLQISPHYLKAAIRDIGLWFIPLIGGIIIQVKSKKFPKIAFIWSFLIVCAIFLLALSFLNTNSDWYNLPTYPLFAIIIAYFCLKIVERFKNVGIVLIVTITLLQAVNFNRIENIYPDRSKVGADLGNHTQKLIPSGSTVILDDHDFTSFLFYSNQGKVYTIEDNKKSDFTEWWKISHKELANFIQTQQNVWIITPNPQNLDLGTNQYEQKDHFNNYYFLKF